jgi:hypothetical protein
MQFTVLIEFLVPGLATTLLLLFLLPAGAVPSPPQGLPTGETASALLLLAVSYPVGILTNFPAFWLQRRLVSVKTRQSIFESYKDRGVNLEELVNKQFNIMLFKDFEQKADEADSTSICRRVYRYFYAKLSLSAGDRPKFKALFDLIGAYVFSQNIERANAYHLFQEGIQRLARGMLLPLLLASIVVLNKQTPGRFYLVLFCIGLAWSSYRLVRHSVNTEYEHLVRSFLALHNNEQRTAVRASTMADGVPSVRAKQPI